MRGNLLFKCNEYEIKPIYGNNCIYYSKLDDTSIRPARVHYAHLIE